MTDTSTDGDAPAALSTSAPATSSGPTRDGRQLRRLRNIEAVRAAILDLLTERAPLDLESVAARAGVTVRSIYRYHADLDAAIADAVHNRVEHIWEVWRTQVLPEPDAPLTERKEAMLNRRMQLEALGRPLRNTIQEKSPDPEFDREVLEVFAPEFAEFSGAELEMTKAAVCYMLRPRGLRSMIEFPQHGGADPRAVIRMSIRRLLSCPPMVDPEAYGPPI